MISPGSDAVVRARLDDWGRVFCYDRAGELLGHFSKNMIQILIDHRGEMPPRATGYKPQEVPLLALEIEQIVTVIAHDAVEIAWALRAYYCGSGRRGVERLALAKALMQRRRLSRRAFYSLADAGMHRVAGMLAATKRKAA